MTSSCHRIKIYSVNRSRELTAKRLREFEEHGEGFTPITRPTEFRTQSEEEYERIWKGMEPRDVDD